MNMDVFDKIDSAIKGWLCDCFDVVDGHKYRKDMIKSLNDQIFMADTQAEILEDLAMVCADTQRITVSIPSVIAPWYEDREFSRLLWDELKEGYITMEDDGEVKRASVIVMPEEVFNDLLR